MTLNEYQTKAMTTAAEGCRDAVNAALGLTGAVGDISKLLDKKLYRDEPHSTVDMMNKLGNALWYLTLIAETYGVELDDVADMNLRKISAISRVIKTPGLVGKAPYTIAADFDGCIVEKAWPEVGEPIWKTINALKARKEQGCAVILWTSRDGEFLQDAIRACDRVGLEFDAINKALPIHVQTYGSDPRKIYADEYWDDKGVHVTKDHCPPSGYINE